MEQAAQTQPFVLIVSGADTGRAPMAVALLQRLLEQQGLTWRVESAGVTGHDNDPAEPEARNAMLSLGLDITEHCARSLTAPLAQDAAVLLTVDSGIAHVIRMQYPALAPRTLTLSGLVGRQRDIPDPFRMQVGAWISYAREIETLLSEGLPHLIQLVDEQTGTTIAQTSPSPSTETAVAAPPPLDVAEERLAAIERCERLIGVMRDMPDLIDWSQASVQIGDAIRQTAQHPADERDLVQAYVALLSASLGMRSVAPGATQLEWLHEAVLRLRQPIDQTALTALSTTLPNWTAA